MNQKSICIGLAGICLVLGLASDIAHADGDVIRLAQVSICDSLERELGWDSVDQLMTDRERAYRDGYLTDEKFDAALARIQRASDNGCFEKWAEDRWRHDEEMAERAVSWQTISFSTELPAPFNSVTVTLQSDDDATEEIAIEVNGKSLKIDEELLIGLSKMRDAEIAHSDPTSDESGSVDYFDVVIPYGERYWVRYRPCDDDRNDELDYDIVLFRVDRSLTVTREISLARTMDQCEK